jgi:hypothetical protein
MSLASKIALLALLLVAAAAGQGTLEGRGGAKRFISLKYGFSMVVPSGWGVSAKLDTPVFFYAPSSGRFVQASIPKGGAVITVEPHDAVSGQGRSATTPRGWALADTRAVASGDPSIEPFLMPRESGASGAVTSSYEEATFSPDQQTQHSVAIFWEFEQKLFAARLNYNANDPRGLTFERVFLQIVRSVRPLGKVDSR